MKGREGDGRSQLDIRSKNLQKDTNNLPRKGFFRGGKGAFFFLVKKTQAYLLEACHVVSGRASRGGIGNFLGAASGA